MQHEPSDEARLAARLALAYPAHVNAYRAAYLATWLCAIERKQRRHAERQCNDSGYHGKREERAERHIQRQLAAWLRELANDAEGFVYPSPSLHGDPRGGVLKIQLEGEPEEITV